MCAEIPGNVQGDSGECSRRFRGMLKKILNLNLDLFCEILLFLSNAEIKMRKTKEMFSALLITTYN